MMYLASTVQHITEDILEMGLIDSIGYGKLTVEHMQSGIQQDLDMPLMMIRLGFEGYVDNIIESVEVFRRH